MALQFLILTAARSGEVRKAQWKDIDLGSAEWRVPPEKAKADKLHIVPLVPAAVDLLEQMRGLFGHRPEDLVFPGLSGMMSDATMAEVLRKNGGASYMVHGFRPTFRVGLRTSDSQTHGPKRLWRTPPKQDRSGLPSHDLFRAASA
jgi:integrase